MSLDLSKTWETYTSAWKTDDVNERQSLFSASLDPSAEYNDPLVSTKGWDELAAYMVDFHKQVPGGHFVTTEFETHHLHSLTSWDMVDANGNKIGEGTSHGKYNTDGKLLAMTGFFDVQS